MDRTERQKLIANLKALGRVVLNDSVKADIKKRVMDGIRENKHMAKLNNS